MKIGTVGTAMTVCLSLIGAIPAHAAARVFVSVFGSDGGDCSNRNTPCRTFGTAITQVDPGGEVIVIDTGSYGGATITKSVKVNVPVGVVAFAASGFTVNAGVTDVVVLRGLTLKALTPGVGSGINFISGAAIHVENCVIDGWSQGIVINPASASSRAYVIDTVVRNCAAEGVAIQPGIVSIDNVRLENNTSGCGVFVFDGTASVLRSVATGNSSGFCATDASALNVEGSMASNNQSFGFFAGTGAVVRLTKCIVTGNDTGLNNNVATIESLGDNLVRGNATNTAGTITIVAGQ